jgi:hypothetical protein
MTLHGRGHTAELAVSLAFVVLVKVRDENDRPFPGEGKRHRTPDPGVCAGYDRLLVSQLIRS